MCTTLCISDLEEKPSFTLVLSQPILEPRKNTHAEGSAPDFHDTPQSGVPPSKNSLGFGYHSFRTGPGEISSFRANLGSSHWLLWFTTRSTCIPLLMCTRTRPCAFHISWISSFTLVLTYTHISKWPSLACFLSFLQHRECTFPSLTRTKHEVGPLVAHDGPVLVVKRIEDLSIKPGR